MKFDLRLKTDKGLEVEHRRARRRLVICQEREQWGLERAKSDLAAVEAEIERRK